MIPRRSTGRITTACRSSSRPLPPKSPGASPAWPPVSTALWLWSEQQPLTKELSDEPITRPRFESKERQRAGRRGTVSSPQERIAPAAHHEHGPLHHRHDERG